MWRLPQPGDSPPASRLRAAANQAMQATGMRAECAAPEILSHHSRFSEILACPGPIAHAGDSVTLLSSATVRKRSGRVTNSTALEKIPHGPRAGSSRCAGQSWTGRSRSRSLACFQDFHQTDCCTSFRFRYTDSGAHFPCPLYLYSSVAHNVLLSYRKMPNRLEKSSVQVRNFGTWRSSLALSCRVGCASQVRRSIISAQEEVKQTSSSDAPS